MISGSAEVSLRTEVRASLGLVAATKLPLLVALWFFECATRPTTGPFALNGPLALRALARWQAREYLQAAESPPNALDPFSGAPFAALLPLPRAFLRMTSFLADAIHVQRPIFAAIVTLLVLVPAIAFVRGALPNVSEGQKAAASIILLLGPGSWFLSSPGCHALFLLAFAAAAYGLKREKTPLVVVASFAAALTHPAGVLLMASCIARALKHRDRRGRALLMALVPAIAIGAMVTYYLRTGQPLEVATAPLRQEVHWPGGGLERLAIAFGPFNAGSQRALDLYAVVAAVFVGTGALLSVPRSPHSLQVLSIGAILFLVRDWTDAPSVAAWCFPAALGWSRLLSRFSVASWIPLVLALGIVPILFRANGQVWDWIELTPERPVVAGEAALAAQQNGALGLATAQREALIDRPGSMQRFDFGAVYCTPSYGCRAIDGVAARRYEEAGGRARCGVPIRDRTYEDGIWSYPLEYGVVRHKPWVFSEAVCRGHRVYSER